MKTHRRLSLVFVAALVSLSVAPWAQTTARGQDDSQENTSSSTTYDSTGRVTAISPPLTITVNSHRGPFTYQLSPDLHVLGAEGKPIKVEQVHKDQTVTVYYYKRLGQETVARIVVLKRTAN